MIKMLGEIKLINTKFIAEPETRHEQIGSHADDQCSVEAGWYVCNGKNYTPNLLDKFPRMKKHAGEAGGSDDAVVVTHRHSITTRGANNEGYTYKTSHTSYPNGYYDGTNYSNYAGVSGVDKNIPAYKSLIPIIKLYDAASGIQIFDIIPEHGWTGGYNNSRFTNEKNEEVRVDSVASTPYIELIMYVKSITSGKDLILSFTQTGGYSGTYEVHRSRGGTETEVDSGNLVFANQPLPRSISVDNTDVQTGDFIKIKMIGGEGDTGLNVLNWSAAEEA